MEDMSCQMCLLLIFMIKQTYAGYFNVFCTTFFYRKIALNQMIILCSIKEKLMIW